jgi:hypothetical protein
MDFGNLRWVLLHSTVTCAIASGSVNQAWMTSRHSRSRHSRQHRSAKLSCMDHEGVCISTLLVYHGTLAQTSPMTCLACISHQSQDDICTQPPTASFSYHIVIDVCPSLEQGVLQVSHVPTRATSATCACRTCARTAYIHSAAAVVRRPALEAGRDRAHGLSHQLRLCLVVA